MSSSRAPASNEAPTIVQALCAGLAGFSLVATVEAVSVTLRARASLDSDLAPTFAATFLLAALAGGPFAAALAVLGPPSVRVGLASLRAARADAVVARALVARSLTSALVALLPIAAVRVATVMAHGFARVDLAGWFVALVCAGALCAAAIARPAVRQLVERATAALPAALRERPSALIATAASTVAASAVALLLAATRGAELGALRMAGPLVLACGAALGVIALIVCALRPRFARFAVLGASTWLVGIALGAAALASTPALTEIVAHGWLSRLDLVTLRSLLDGDGDGYSQSLAGGDCDDADPTRHPGATDTAENGVDENCDGEDARPDDPADDASARAQASGRAPRRDSIVWILLDSLRADRLGAYGYARSTSPHLDAFAASACSFEVARSQAPNTPRSFPSMLTGRYPSRLEWVEREASFGDLAPGQRTMFGAFHAAGYRTEAVTAHPYFQSIHELRRDVDAWDDPGTLSLEDSMTASTAPDVTARALARLDALYAAARPFFLFVHYSEPHGRYVPHEDGPAFGDTPSDRYDGEIAFLDAHVGRLFDALSRQDRRERTTVVVLSDHGEAFQEHGLGLHGRTVFEEEVRVPLLIRVPDAAPRRSVTPVGLIDVFPTLGELMGIDASTSQGVSLVRELYGEPLGLERVLFMEQLPYSSYRVHMVAAVEDDLKVVRDITNGAAFAFDLRADPHEQASRLQHDPERFEALTRQLSAFIAATP